MPTFHQLERLAEAEIAACLLRLPAELREHAERLPVICAWTPEDVDETEDLDLLGLFTGAAFDAGFDEISVEPTQIFLFLGNIWEFAEGNRRAFLEEVRITYFHELGHYFGWDEEEIAERGLG